MLERVRQAHHDQAQDKSFEKSHDFDSTAEESLLAPASAPGLSSLLGRPKLSPSELHNLDDELDRILSASIGDSEQQDELQLDRKSTRIPASTSIKPKIKESSPLLLGAKESQLSDDISDLLLGGADRGKLSKPKGGLTTLSSLPPLSSVPLSKLPTLTSPAVTNALSAPPPPVTSTITGSRDFLDVLNQPDHNDYEDDFDELPSQHPPVSPGHHLASLSQDKLSLLSDAISEEGGREEDEGSDDTPLMKDFEDLQLTLSPDDDLGKLAETSYHKRRLSLENKLENDKTVESMYSDDSTGSEF